MTPPSRSYSKTVRSSLSNRPGPTLFPPFSLLICNLSARSRFTFGRVSKLGFQFPDLIAQQRSLFKFQVDRRLHHFLLQTAQRLCHIEISANLSQTHRGLVPPALVNGQAILNCPANAARRDIMLQVIGKLLRAAIF